MKRIGKFFGTVLLMGVIVAVIIGGMNAFFMGKYHAMEIKKYVEQPFAGQGDQRGAMQQPGFSKGEGPQQFAALAGHRFDQQPQKFAHPQAFYAQREHHGFGFGKLIFGLIALVIGWKLWKRGGLRRWIGAGLIAIVVLPLLLAALSLLFPLILIYLAWRFFRRGRRRAKEGYATFVMTDNQEYQTTRAVDYLDEWETKTRRQLNNKEEK